MTIASAAERTVRRILRLPPWTLFCVITAVVLLCGLLSALEPSGILAARRGTAAWKVLPMLYDTDWYGRATDGLAEAIDGVPALADLMRIIGNVLWWTLSPFLVLLAAATDVVLVRSVLFMTALPSGILSGTCAIRDVRSWASRNPGWAPLLTWAIVACVVALASWKAPGVLEWAVSPEVSVAAYLVLLACAMATTAVVERLRSEHERKAGGGTCAGDARLGSLLIFAAVASLWTIRRSSSRRVAYEKLMDPGRLGRLYACV